MQPADLDHLISLGAPTIAPDASTLVVAASRPDLEADEYRSRLWIIALDGGDAPRELTHGDRDSAPAYSPDGRWLAFLRSHSGAGGAKARPQLYVLPTGGGDALAITELPGGAGAPVWSPDSLSIAFVARVPDAGRHGLDDAIPADKEAPRRITGLQYRLDDVGFVIDQRRQVFVVDLADATPRRITDGDYENYDVAWSPDGTRLAFVSARHAGRERDGFADVHVVDADGSSLRRVTDTTLSVDHPLFTPTGDRIVFCAEDPGPGGQTWFARQSGVYVVDAAGGVPHRLTDPERVNVLADTLAVDDHDAYVLYENRGANDLIRVPLDGTEPETISAGRRQLTGFDRAGDVLAVAYADDSTAGEAGLVTHTGIRALTDFGARLREHTAPLPMIELTSTAEDGRQLHGFLVAPDSPGPHPVLLMIHGGPFTQYGWKLHDEAQVYAGAGYAVVYTNPRGSSGYGASYGAYVRGDVGERSAQDLLTLLDDALARPELDERRVGVLGGSHGGFMTGWLVGHTDRFFAAVSERAVNAIDSFAGSSDIGWYFAADVYGSDPAQQHRQSPLTYAGNISTPLLIIHSEHDWRCPIEQAQRLYVALRLRDAPVELLVFPGEGHELSRSGLPSHRVARFHAILDWFARHLPS